MDEELLKHQPPQSLEAEQAVLGSILIDSRCVADVVGILTPEDFFLRQNQEIFETIYTMFNFSQTIDPVTVLNKMKELGVSTWAVIHCPEVGYGLDDNNNLVEVPSLKLPKGFIRGTVGAGDAFCAGALIGIYNGWSDMEIMEFASACAVMALSSPDATSGMKTGVEIKNYCRLFASREVAK